MSKTNKELAVDIAIEYIHGLLHQAGEKGSEAFTAQECSKLINEIYRTLENLDKGQ